MTGTATVHGSHIHVHAVETTDVRLRELLETAFRDVYEDGYSDGQSNPNGYSSKADRDSRVREEVEALVKELLK